jgi:4-amino-4-deoxy-L-arabinose transferase-like glycosyltransferase
MNNRIATIILLSLIIILAFILRVYSLGQVPAGFHEDEVAYGYNAYSLLLTGKDEYGKHLPLVLQSFGEYKPALYAYLTIPWIALFDLTPFAVRFTTALFGVFSVVLLYFFVNKLFKNQKIALITAALLAISPWHLNLSRTASEVVVSLFFILVLLYAILSLKEKFSLLWFALAIVSGILAIGSYTASRFFVLLLVGIFLFLPWGQAKKVSGKRILLGLLGVFIVAALLISNLDSAKRFNQISILSTPETQLVLEEQIREDQSTPPFIARTFHNKIVNYGHTLLHNYSEYLTLDFLLFNGVEPPRMQIADAGLFYIWQMPFLLIGLYVLVRKRNNKSVLLISWWLILLLPAAFTANEIPHVYRALIVLPPMLIILAIGIYTCCSYVILKRSRFLMIIAALLLILSVWELFYYQHQYYIHQERHRPWYRGYAYKPLAEALQTLAPKYKKIIITKSHGSPYIHLLFYSKYNPSTYQAEGSLRDMDYKGFGKYIFVPETCSTQADMANLYVVKGECDVPKNFKLVKTITWQDGTAAFKLIEYLPY